MPRIGLHPAAALVGLILASRLGYGRALNCTGRPDGIYEASCQSYTRCKEGNATAVVCQKPNVVNMETGDCAEPLAVGTPCGTYRDCEFRDDGNYPDTGRQCRWYYTCQYGLFYSHHPCPADLVLNTDLQICDFKFNVAPPCGTKGT